ncbi:MAG: O-antigen ligase family protein [Thiothrix sp.]|uniref:O-antigen ligase family protein n=1 Tax=Thiothrix sp. TaxID=1032 RepID=UPI002604442C|nr:O-antigen ligase family protein [Thiothrix sp.]MDD5391379.1 O-antigen ligase family protein [Thiothrix sp.]
MMRNVLLALIFFCLLMLTVLPFELAAPYHDSQRLISTVMVAVALSASIWFARLSRRALWGLVGLYVYGGLQVVFSPIAVWSLVEFSLLFSVVLLAVTLLSEVSRRDMTVLAVFFTLIQAFYLTRNLTNYVFVMATGAELDAFALVDGFSNVRFYGQFLLWTIPFVLGVLVTHERLPYRYAIVAVLSLGWGFEFLTGTRAFVLGMLVSVPVVAWVARGYGWRYLQYCVPTAALGFGVYYLMAFVLPEWLGNADKMTAMLAQSVGRDVASSHDRITLWLDAARLMLAHPLWGAGPMSTAVQGVSDIAAHPHNYVVQLMAEWGMPFTLLLAVAAIRGIIRWRQCVQVDAVGRAPLAVPIAASAGAVSVGGLVDGFLVMPVSLIYMTLVLAVAVGLWRKWTPQVERMPIPVWGAALLLLPALFLAAFTGVSWSGVMGDDVAVTGFHALDDGHPRFWIRGRIVVENWEQLLCSS